MSSKNKPDAQIVERAKHLWSKPNVKANYIKQYGKDNAHKAVLLHAASEVRKMREFTAQMKTAGVVDSLLREAGDRMIDLWRGGMKYNLKTASTATDRYSAPAGPSKIILADQAIDPKTFADGNQPKVLEALRYFDMHKKGNYLKMAKHILTEETLPEVYPVTVSQGKTVIRLTKLAGLFGKMQRKVNQMLTARVAKVPPTLSTVTESMAAADAAFKKRSLDVYTKLRKKGISEITAAGTDSALLKKKADYQVKVERKTLTGKMQHKTLSGKSKQQVAAQMRTMNDGKMMGKWKPAATITKTSAEILSQKEIDALLSGISEKAPKAKSAIKPDKARTTAPKIKKSLISKMVGRHAVPLTAAAAMSGAGLAGYAIGKMNKQAEQPTGFRTQDYDDKPAEDRIASRENRMKTLNGGFAETSAGSKAAKSLLAGTAAEKKAAFQQETGAIVPQMANDPAMAKADASAKSQMDPRVKALVASFIPKNHPANDQRVADDPVRIPLSE